MTKSTPTIEILKKGALIKAFPLGVSRLVVGSGAKANIRLRSAAIRPEHLAIELVERRFLQVVNLAGDPELTCDGQPFETCRLRNGSEVQLGDVMFRLRLEPVARPASSREDDVGTDTAESFPIPDKPRSPRHSPPPPVSEEDAPTPKAQPAVETVEPRGPARPTPPASKSGMALAEDTELSLEEEESPEEAKAAEKRAVGTSTVPMLGEEAEPWDQDVAPPTPEAPAPAPPRASPATPRPLPFLMIHPPGARRKRVRLPVGTFDLGSKGCAISLHFAGVAERHAVLTTHADGSMTVEDAGSGLPTILNGRVIRRSQFRLEDTLQIGRVSFTLEAAPPAATPPDAPGTSPEPPGAAVDDAPPEPPRSAFQAQASAKWVEAALRKRESSDEEDDSLPGVPLSKAAAEGATTDPVSPATEQERPAPTPPPSPSASAPTPAPARPTPPSRPAVEASPPAPAQVRPTPPTPPAAEAKPPAPAQARPTSPTPPAAEAKPPAPAQARPSPPPPPARPAPPASGRAPSRPPKRAPAPPAKVRKGPPPSATRPPRRRREPAAEMPSEYKWQKRRRAALWILFILMLLTAGGAYGGWRIYQDRTTRGADSAGQPINYSWGDGSGDESEYTWAGLVGASGKEGEEEDDDGRSSRRRRSRRSSDDVGSGSAIASADGSWSGVDDKAPAEEEEEDPEQRMLKDLMNESMDILDEEFESKKKAWIDMDEVETTLQSVSSTARVCYKRALEEDPDLAGTMHLRITIGTRGKVESISLDSMSTLANSEMQKCVERQVRSKSYPAARGGSVTFTYPFRFSDR